MKQPMQSGEKFLLDVERAASEPGAVHLWWLGQSGFLIQWAGRHLLFDPYLSDWLTRKYAGTEKPHVRITDRVVDPARLDFIDVVTSTHNHTDHLDAATLKPLLQVNDDLKIVVPEANRAFAAERLGIDPATFVGLDAGQSAEVAGFKLTAVPAAHEALDRDAAGRYKYVGYVAEFGEEAGRRDVTTTRRDVGPDRQPGPSDAASNRRWTVYHSGDTIRYDGMAERLSKWDVDIALLPINGSDPARGVAGNLSGPEAAQLAKDIGAGVAIPCHFDMFEFNTASPDAFIEACRRLNQRCVVLKNGERWTLDL